MKQKRDWRSFKPAMLSYQLHIFPRRKPPNYSSENTKQAQSIYLKTPYRVKSLSPGPPCTAGEKAYAECGLAGLAGQYDATRTSTVPSHMQDFIKGLLTERPHLGIPTIHQAIQARFAGQQIPGQSSIRRFVSNWKQEHQSLIQYVTSFDQWRSNHMIALGKADEHVTRLNQVWEFDSTPGDIMLIDGRHNLIGVIDVYSRRAKIHVSPTSKASAIAALTRRTILDWGVPEVAKTDNGSDTYHPTWSGF